VNTNRRRSTAIPSRLIVALVILATVGLGGSRIFMQGWKAVPVDKVALHYTGGPIQGERFKKVVAPGTGTHFYGLFEQLFELPATQRSYIMSKDATQGDARRSEYVGAPSADKVMTEWESATYFTLNTRPDVLRRFFEQICLKYTCTDLKPGGGWDRMLADTFRQQIVAAIQAEARRHLSEDIYANADTFRLMQANVGSTLKQRVNDVLGGEYFCGPGYDAGKPGCPEFSFVIKEVTLPANVRDQYNANRASALAVDKARADALSQAALRTAPDLTAGQIDYIRAQAELECARRAQCVLVIGGGVNTVQVTPRI
jgi:hypothetical protein